MRFKKFIPIAALILCGSAMMMSGCSEKFQREMKTYQSNFSGGLNRTVTLYD